MVTTTEDQTALALLELARVLVDIAMGPNASLTALTIDVGVTQRVWHEGEGGAAVVGAAADHQHLVVNDADLVGPQLAGQLGDLGHGGCMAVGP